MTVRDRKSLAERNDSGQGAGNLVLVLSLLLAGCVTLNSSHARWCCWFPRPYPDLCQAACSGEHSFVVLGIKPRALYMPGTCPTSELHPSLGVRSSQIRCKASVWQSHLPAHTGRDQENQVSFPFCFQLLGCFYIGQEKQSTYRNFW